MSKQNGMRPVFLIRLRVRSIRKKATSRNRRSIKMYLGIRWLELAEQNERIVGITPAMPSGSSMNIMMEAMPHRAFDVGIAEQHAVTFSAGVCDGRVCYLFVIFTALLCRGLMIN